MNIIGTILNKTCLIILIFLIGCTVSDKDKNVKLIHRFYHEVHNAQKLEVIEELFSENYVAYNPTGAVDYQGIEGEKTHMTESFAFFPDLKTTVQNTISDNEKIVVRWSGKATHDSIEVKLSGVTIYTVKKGKIVEARHFYDQLCSLTQLGYTVQKPE